MTRRRRTGRARDTRDALVALAALASLVVSVRACQQSQKALDLSANEYKSERQAVWVGTPDSDNAHMAVRAAQEGVILERASITFPTSLGIDMQEVAPPGLTIALEPVRARLQEILPRRFAPKPGHVIVPDEQVDVPIAIQADYIARGEGHLDRSLYSLRYDFAIRAGSPPRVTFDGLFFLRRLKPSEGGQQEVDTVAQQGTAPAVSAP